MAEVSLKCRFPALVDGSPVKRGASVTVDREKALVLLATNRFLKADSPEAAEIKPNPKPAAKKQAAN